jgi:protein-S-isoprenylcysteine O-methyltransferase Ste14
MTQPAAETPPAPTAGVIAPPPVIYLAFLGLGFVLEGLLPGAELPGWAQWTGDVVIVAGVVLVISFERAIKRAGTDANPYRPSTALATDGPYRSAAIPRTWAWRSPTSESRSRPRRPGRS